MIIAIGKALSRFFLYQQAVRAHPCRRIMSWYLLMIREVRHKKALVELAKHATQQVWGIPSEKLDAADRLGTLATAPAAASR